MAEDKLSIKEAFQGMIPASVELLQGTVTSVSPLKIQIVNDAKLIISDSITVVPRHLTDYTVTADISGGSVSGATGEAGEELHSHSVISVTHKKATVTVYNALKVGDRLHILSVQNGKKYFVLDRV